MLRIDAESNDMHGGHIPRNTRLTLSAVDIVQPYVCLSTASSLLSLATTGRPSPATSRGLAWYAGGGVYVDRTWLSWHPSDASLALLSPEAWEGYVLTSLAQPQPPVTPHTSSWTLESENKGHGVESLEAGFPASGILSGAARWTWTNPLDVSSGHIFTVDALSVPPLESVTSAARLLKSRHGLRGGYARRSGSVVEVELLLVAWAEVDQSWGAKGQGHPTTVTSSRRHLDEGVNGTADGTRTLTISGEPFPPQTHLANARTNPDWQVKNDKGEVKVQGRKFWPSDPIMVTVQYPVNGPASSATVEVKSAVTECAWWKRGKRSS